MNKNNIWILAASFVALAAVACTPEQELQMTERLSLKLDPALSVTEKNLLVGDVNTLMGYQLAIQPTGVFPKIFGGVTTEDVLRYLDERVNYIIPESVDIESRIRTSRFIDPITLPIPGEDRQHGAYVMAANVGMALWLNSELQSPRGLDFTVGDTRVPLTSSRNGIIQLGKGYTKRRWLGLGAYLFPSLQRTFTLVHEARHSDCTGGLSKADLDRIAHGKDPSSRVCGHMHVNCPAGHPFAGLPACDDHAWGAYAVEAIFEIAVSKACTNCTTVDKVMAKATALDALSRVTVLEDMMAGRLGDPDMSSSGLKP